MWKHFDLSNHFRLGQHSTATFMNEFLTINFNFQQHLC